MSARDYNSKGTGKGQTQTLKRDRNKMQGSSSPNVITASKNGSGDVTKIRRNIGSASYMETLSPDDLVIQPENFDLELEECGSVDSGSGTDTESDGEMSNPTTGRMFGMVEPTSLKDLVPISNAVLPVDQTEEDRLMIAKLEAEGSDIDSEEERSIMKEIKYEIQNQVKEEMKDELAIYKYKKEKLQQQDAAEPESELEGLEPKLREAILKMRKLDRVLAKKMKKERDVKRQRLMLQKQLREELDNLKPEGRELKEVKVNTERFLALAPPPSHNEGIKLTAFPSPPVTPLFQTQLPDDHSKHDVAGSHASEDNDDIDSNLTSSSRLTDDDPNYKDKMRRKSKKDKNFIERNVQLASDAANVVAMTDDEKARLKLLLKDIDDDTFLDDMSLEDNNQQVAVSLGDGYLPNSEEMKRLNAIDDRLRRILPPEDFETVASTPRSWSSVQPSTLFTRTDMFSTTDDNTPGEVALRETKDNRDVHQRLEDIERQLARMQVKEPLPIESPQLSQIQLNDLLNHCAKSMSRASSVNTVEPPKSPDSVSVENSSALTELYNDPPTLSDDVLQKLIADCKQSLQINEPTVSTSDEETPTNTPRNERLVLESITEASMEFYSPSLREEEDEDQATCSRESSASSTRSGPSFLPQIDPKGQLSTQKLNNNFVSHSNDSSRSSTPVMLSRNATLSAASVRSNSSSVSHTNRPPGAFIDNLHSDGSLSFNSGRPNFGTNRSSKYK